MSDVLRAEARIDLGALDSNVRRIREVSPDSLTMVVVKADAYGHGLVPCAAQARRSGAEWLGVALPEEAVTLREAGDTGPLLTWLQVPGDPSTARAVELGVDVSASSVQMVAEVAEAARALGTVARLHLKVDTGLTRNGAIASDWDAVMAAAAAAQAGGEVKVIGIFSHFAYADEPGNPVIASQIARFDDAVAAAERHGLRPELKHLANSAATFTLPKAHYDMVRPGIAAYGISPGLEVGSEAELGLHPVMSLRAPLALVKDVPAGQGVSYGHQYVTTQQTTVGLIALGYADGIPRAATNVGPVAVAGARRAIAGRVCMDQICVDLEGERPDADAEAVLFGDPQTESVAPGIAVPTATEWAEVCQTIPYEIVTRIGPRVPRTYVNATPDDR